LIEFFFEKKILFFIYKFRQWNFWHAKLLRDKWISAPGKNNAFWTETNTAYRFTPSGAGSRFREFRTLYFARCIVMTADTLTTVPGLLDIRFPNACFPAGSNQYVVKQFFSACDNPINQLISYDTITVSRLNSLGATAVTTNAGCGTPDGTIQVTVPLGIGTPPYTFVLDGVTHVLLVQVLIHFSMLPLVRIRLL